MQKHQSTATPAQAAKISGPFGPTTIDVCCPQRGCRQKSGKRANAVASFSGLRNISQRFHRFASQPPHRCLRKIAGQRSLARSTTLLTPSIKFRICFGFVQLNRLLVNWSMRQVWSSCSKVLCEHFRSKSNCVSRAAVSLCPEWVHNTSPFRTVFEFVQLFSQVLKPPSRAECCLCFSYDAGLFWFFSVLFP